MAIAAWLLMSIFITLFHRYIVLYYDGWSPSALTRIEGWYGAVQVLLLAVVIVSVIGFIIQEIEHSFIFERTLAKRFLPLVKAIFYSIVWIVAFFYILEKLHINTRNILAGAGIGGAIIAFASKDIFTNLLGSLSILLSNTFEIGEFIRVRVKSGVNYEGFVEEITLNYTKITNRTGEVIYMPNRIIYTETVENLSRRRFYDYTYHIPFAKALSSKEVETRLRIIEGKIQSYDPIEIIYDTEIPNAVDFVYKITVLMPDENLTFDREMKHFLVDYIFQSR